MSSGRYAMRGWAFQGRWTRPLGLAGSNPNDTDPKTGWHSVAHSRVVVSRSDRVLVAAKHSRIVVLFPEVRR